MMDEGSSGYRMFWTQLLDKARERTDLHNARLRPGTAWYMGVNQGGITYNYALRKNSAYIRRVVDRQGVRRDQRGGLSDAASA